MQDKLFLMTSHAWELSIRLFLETKHIFVPSDFVTRNAYIVSHILKTANQLVWGDASLVWGTGQNRYRSGLGDTWDHSDQSRCIFELHFPSLIYRIFWNSSRTNENRLTSTITGDWGIHWVTYESSVVSTVFFRFCRILNRWKMKESTFPNTIITVRSW